MSATAKGLARVGPAKTPLELLWVSNWLLEGGGGGIQTYLASSACALSGEPFRISYAAVMPGSIPAFVRLGDDIAVHLGTRGSLRVLNVLRLRNWLRSHIPSFDVVHFHGPLGPHFLMGAPVAQQCGIPYVVNAHGSLSLAVLARLGYAARMAYRLRGRALLRNAAAVLATSELEARIIRSTDASLNIRVVAPGMSVPERPVLEHREGGETRPLRVVFLGRVAPIKAIPVLLAAIARLRPMDPGVRLDVLGSGANGYLDELRKQARDLGIGANVIWHGHLTGDPKIAVLRQSDVLALPSYSESHGFSAVEAMALGLPVVVSEGVGIADTLNRYKAGAVVPVGDANALADALAAHRVPAHRRNMGHRAHACALREFSLASMGKGLSAVYREAADR